MTKIKIRWSNLGSPTPPGTYRFGLNMVRVTIGDIQLAKGGGDHAQDPTCHVSL